MKTSAKHFGLAVGPKARQLEPKWPQNYFTYDVSHKKSAPHNQKIFFKCRLEDLPRLLRLLPGLYSIQDRRNSHTKPRAFRRFFFWKSPKAAGLKGLQGGLNMATYCWKAG